MRVHLRARRLTPVQLLRLNQRMSPADPPTPDASKGIPKLTGPDSPDTGATSVPTPIGATDASKPDAALPTPTDASGQTDPGGQAGSATVT